MANDYTRGEMDISHHKATFDGVMSVSVFASILTGLVVLYLTLVFGAAMNWMVALMVSVVVGGIAGFVLKQGALYWVFVAVLAVIAVISGGLVSALG
eukprot:TRINITY_DN42394_c0_g1_i1.p1 TRINITY_DN42394_c0_g1~~TRINITY_DN42394_c0_g1_i1.p1  ORF type:complete len:106 (-),score=9.40 TRINITY_DN42394_c0_g1_i1:89-379(-)